MNSDQQAAIRMLANDLHRLNQSVMKAVEAGVSVELVRSARHHGGDGNWGDLLIPVVVAAKFCGRPTSGWPSSARRHLPLRDGCALFAHVALRGIALTLDFCSSASRGFFADRFFREAAPPRSHGVIQGRARFRPGFSLDRPTVRRPG